MPFLAGPGSIIAAVLLTEDDMFSLVEQAVTSAIAVGLCLLTYVILASADVLQRYLGTTGTSIMSRIFGLVLAALAMQTMLDGLRPYFKSLLH
jgi:multiple antibiotic resistance protein